MKGKTVNPQPFETSGGRGADGGGNSRSAVNETEQSGPGSKPLKKGTEGSGSRFTVLEGQAEEIEAESAGGNTGVEKEKLSRRNSRVGKKTLAAIEGGRRTRSRMKRFWGI